MTILEAIQQVDLQIPNRFSYEEKCRWLSELDGLIFRELYQLYEGVEDCRFPVYEEGIDHPLLVQEPYAQELYLRYLESRMDDAHGDTERYHNSRLLFQAAYMNYARWYNRSHKPLSRERRYQ